MGGFQQSSRETFLTKTKNQEQLPTSQNPIFIEELSQEADDVVATNSNELQIVTLVPEFKVYSAQNKKLSNALKVETIQTEGDTKLSEKTSEQKILRPLKRNPVFNDSLKIGLVFLLIAAALSFMPALLQLAVLFAVVAMVFLIIGLKKLFNRRAKIKQKKIRKENNQMRKEKIKDIFKK